MHDFKIETYSNIFAPPFIRFVSFIIIKHGDNMFQANRRGLTFELSGHGIE